MFNKKMAGILLHISSLPSNYGIGSLGKSAYDFIDFLHACNLKIWQILPLVPTNYGNSPYQSVCSMALNYYFIDFDILIAKNLLKNTDLSDNLFGNDNKKVDYELLFKNKVLLLKRAFLNFDTNDNKFKQFLKETRYHDFAIYMTLKEMFDYKPWYEFDKRYQIYSYELEKEILETRYQEYLFWQWTQFEFLDEWNKLHAYALAKDVKILGDMPLYVAYDSVEVYKHPELFILHDDKRLKLVAGCPPDAFSSTGQLWGNPIYNWDYLKSTNYAWWNKRLQVAFELYDYVRIDHFRGFSRYFAIDAGETTAINGKWNLGPGFDFFKDKLDLNIIAEDLGYIDDDVRTLMKQTNYPGMKVLSFAFDGNSDNEHKPSNYIKNIIAYTGTHDNMPLHQYLTSLNKKSYDLLLVELKNECDKLMIPCKETSVNDVIDTMIELLFFSKASVCIIPMQDILKQDKEARMNFPSTLSKDNWAYRITKSDLNESLVKKINELVYKSSRS